MKKIFIIFVIMVLTSTFTFAALTDKLVIINSGSTDSSQDTLQSVTERGSTTNITTYFEEGITTNELCLGSECKNDWVAVDGVTGEFLATYSASKGTQLMTNSWLLQDTLYNWQQETNLVRPIELYTKDSVGYKHSVLIYDTTRVVSQELIPVDTTKTYIGEIWLRNLNSTAGSIFSGMQAFDKYGNSIGVGQYAVQDTTKRTYLTQPACPGQNKIFVSDMSTWNDSNNNVFQRVAFFTDLYYRENYFDHYYAQGVLVYNNAGMNYSENSITMTSNIPNLATLTNPTGIWRVPANETCIPAGTPVANTFLGASYNYFIHGGYSVLSAQNWTYRYGLVRPRPFTELGNPTDMFRPGTSFVRLLTLGSAIPTGQAFLVDGLQMKEYQTQQISSASTRPYITFGLSYHLNPKIEIRDNRISWYVGSHPTISYSIDAEIYRSTTNTLRTDGNFRVDRLQYNTLQALSPHALLGDESGFTRICKQATDGTVVMEKIEFIDGKYQNVYYSGEADCQKIQLKESHEKEYIAIDETTQIERTHGVYENVWTKETEINYKDEIVTIPQYEIGIYYPVGKHISYNGKTYKVLQQHTSQSDWLPNIVPAIYQEVKEQSAEWKQPFGAHDCYQLRDTVTFNGQTYESTHSCNVWQPPTLWKLI